MGVAYIKSPRGCPAHVGIDRKVLTRGFEPTLGCPAHVGIDL